jgi:hypothetical protein
MIVRFTSPEIVFEGCFTDRDQGEGFVLSAFRAASGAGKGKYIITYCIHATCDGCMEGKLLCMCQNVVHVYKKIANGVQMYNNNRVNTLIFLL